MKIQFVSDLHIEQWYPRVPFIEDLFPIDYDAEIIILVGDIGRLELFDQLSKFIHQLSLVYRHIYYVIGNHEYYSSQKIPMNLLKARLFTLEMIYNNVTILDDRAVLVTDIMQQPVFYLFGSMLWSYIPENVYRPLPIYTQVGSLITREEWNTLHTSAITSFNKFMNYERIYNIPVVVATHYSPLFYETLDPKYRRFDPKNHYYCTDLRHLFKSVHTWIYGHTGYNTDITVEGTRVVSNQRDKVNNNPIIEFPEM